MIKNPSSVSPEITLGPNGNISNLSNNSYFDKLYAPSNYIKTKPVKYENGTFTFSSSDTGYGIALCVECSSISNIVCFFKSSIECSTSFTYFDENNQYISFEYKNYAHIPSNVKYVVVCIVPSILNKECSINNIIISNF